MPKTHKPYPAEFRADAVRLVRAGTPLSRVARDLDVSSELLRHWVKQTDLDSGRRQDGLTSEEREELRKLRREKPLRYVVRVADRSCGPAPICVAASASINRCIGVFQDAAQHVRVRALELREQCRGHHPVLGHRGSPGLGKSFQENSAVAFPVYLVGSAGVTPDLHHTTQCHPDGRTS